MQFLHNVPLHNVPLRHRAVDAVEEMDKPGCDPGKLERTYRQFPLINSVVAGWRRTYRRQVRPHLIAAAGASGPGTTGASASLLDVGCGGGDLARAIAGWAARDGLRLDVTGIDPDQRAYDFAVSQPPVGGVSFRRAFSSELVAEGLRYDVVISNHMLHHLTPAELQGLLQDSAALCRRAAVHSDIARSPVGYALFSVGTLPFFPGSFIRQDGLTSIRRSYTGAELRAVAPPPWTVQSQVPYCNLLLLEKNA